LPTVTRPLITILFHLPDAFLRAARFSLTLRLAAAIDSASAFVLARTFLPGPHTSQKSGLRLYLRMYIRVILITSL
jgi:hypothetical protein